MQITTVDSGGGRQPLNEEKTARRLAFLKSSTVFNLIDLRGNEA